MEFCLELYGVGGFLGLRPHQDQESINPRRRIAQDSSITQVEELRLLEGKSKEVHTTMALYKWCNKGEAISV